MGQSSWSRRRARSHCRLSSPVGPWIRITDGQWDDKPHWSPDGKTIYFVSRRHGFYNVFGIRFDSAKGEPVGSPFPVTEFNNPSAMIPRNIMAVELGISQDRLLINVEQMSGNIWVLEPGGGPFSPQYPYTHQRVQELGYRRGKSDTPSSPDGRWIVFEGAVGTESSVYVVPASGTAPWIRITDGKHWADKPRWSPDGSSIYYISEQKGYFNLWGRRFDPKSGRPQGEPFPVTSFDSPKMMVGTSIPNIGLSVTEEQLVLTVTQESGSIWMLDNVDR